MATPVSPDQEEARIAELLKARIKECSFTHESFAAAVGVHPSRVSREDRVIRGGDAQKLIAQLRTGQTVRTRYYAWPRHEERVGTSSIDDLPSLIDECKAYTSGA